MTKPVIANPLRLYGWIAINGSAGAILNQSGNLNFNKSGTGVYQFSPSDTNHDFLLGTTGNALNAIVKARAIDGPANVEIDYNTTNWTVLTTNTGASPAALDASLIFEVYSIGPTSLIDSAL